MRPVVADASALVEYLLRTSRAEEVGRVVDLPLTRHGHETVVARALGLRENFSAYDATYLALAERLEATLLTADRKLSNAVSRHTAVRLEPIR